MDKHLNCFLSYNYDNELIENNLTRAFIVTLMGLSDETQKTFLHSLNSIFKLHVISSAKFALQDNIEINPKNFKYKYIVTISTDTFYYLKKEFDDIDKDIIKSALYKKVPPSGISEAVKGYLKKIGPGGSIPDAWIYDGSNNNYCFLIECKKQSDQIYYPQILRHAYEKFGLDDIDEIDRCTTRLTWYEILEELLKIIENGHYINEQEKFLIKNLIQYLGFLGYRKFKGFDFCSLKRHPDFKINMETTATSNERFFNYNNFVLHPYIRLIMIESVNLFAFNRLKKSPEIEIKISPTSGLDRTLYHFGDLEAAPYLEIHYKGGS